MIIMNLACSAPRAFSRLCMYGGVMDDEMVTKKGWTSPTLEALDMNATAAGEDEGTESFQNQDGSES